MSLANIPHKYLTYEQARDIFDKGSFPYEYDRDKPLKPWEQWDDYSDEILRGEAVKGDCEDSAFTWGSLAYLEYGVSKDVICLVRGRSPQAHKGTVFDHAWAVIDGWLFDIWETGPRELEFCQHEPHDFITMADPMTPHYWFPAFTDMNA